MRLDVTQDILDELGGLPIQSTIKPLLDLLVSIKRIPSNNGPLFSVLKGGIAYRRWQFENRDSINDVAELAAEVQAGLGYTISD
jgi:hypothetical protein